MALQFNNSFTNSADISQIRATGESMQDTFLDYITHGTVSALTSAAVGFYNTGVAFGDAIGFDVEDSYANEASVIQDTFGDETAAFYRRHKTGIDLAGFVAGSFIPGGAAISALRAAQRAGKLTTGMSLASGMKTADLVLGSPAMKEATASVLGRASFSLKNPAVWRAYGRGLGQQVLEASVAETAIILTSNQNASVNPDDLSYFEATKSQLSDATPFALGAGVIGGGLEAFRIRGALKRSWQSEWLRTADLANPELPATIGLSAGDQVLLYSRTLDDFRNSPDFQVTAGDDFALKQKQAGDNIIRKAINDAVIKLNQTQDDTVFRTLDKILEGDETGKIDFDKVDTLLSDLDAVTNFSRSELDNMQQFYAKTNSPFLAANIVNLDFAPARAAADLEQLGDYVFNQVRGTQPKLDRETFINNFVKDTQKFLNPEEGSLGKARVFSGETRKYKATVADFEQGIVLPSAFTVTDRFDSVAMDQAMAITNGLRKQLGLKSLKRDDMVNLTQLHELTHAKANSPLQMNAFYEKLSNVTTGHWKSKAKSEVFLQELISLSKQKRNYNFQWSRTDAILKDISSLTGVSEGEAVIRLLSDNIPSSTRLKFGKDAISGSAYVLNPQELLADAGAMLAYGKTAEETAKQFPQVAKFFDDFGGLAKSWTPAKAYYNVRTGQTLRSYLPGINDIGKITINSDGLVVQKLNRTFKKSSKGFTRLFAGQGKFDETFKIEHDYLDFSAQYAIAQKVDLDNFRHSDGSIQLDQFDLPMIERMLTEKWDSSTVVKFQHALDTGRVDNFATEFSGEGGKELLSKYLTETKLQMRGMLAAADGANFNEQEIAHILNMDVDRAMGFDTGEINLMGSRDYGRPEVLVMNYANKSPGDYKVKAHSLQATQERHALITDQREKLSAELLGEDYDKLIGTDRVNSSVVGSVNETETRAGLFNQIRTDFGSVREMFSQVGNQVRKIKERVNREVTEDFANYFETFNRAENGHLRAELASASNLMSRDWYKLAVGVDADGNRIRFMMRKDLSDDPNFWGVKSPDEVPDIRELNAEGIAKLEGMLEAGDQKVVRFSDEVGSFMETHQRRNAALVAKKKKVAGIYGKQYTADPDVLYAPPRDLNNTKHFAFVIPTVFTSGADSRKFMVYGQTAEELQLKTQKLTESYGNKYKVVTNQEAQQYKQLTKEYDSGLVFDEMQFDQALFRKGTSAEVAPNIDLQGSYTLERFSAFHHRQEEYVINSAIEIKYADAVEQLRRIDAERSKFVKSGFGAKEQPGSIWKDTERLLFDDRAPGGAMEQLWVRVNDFIGEKGSEVLASGMDILNDAVRPGVRLTQEKLDEYNAHLAANGFDTPFTKVSEAIIASPNLSRSNAVPSLVRTFNGLVSTMMLRLDTANSIIQVMSSPILMMPVLKEAKEALRNTPRYAELEELTSVLQPATGLREPSSMKMMMNATKRFFTAEGKEFLEELRSRGIVSDFLQQYIDANDFSKLNGRHNLQDVQGRIEKIAAVGSKYSGFNFSEEFTRFLTADSIRQIAEIRGIPKEEMFTIAGSAVDKVHGIYRQTQRVQLFQGPLGQAVGLYQTYFFNFVQNALKWAGDTDRKKLALQAALQGSIFGMQSFPGFRTFNQAIGELNADENFADLYDQTGASEEGTLGNYLMYGLGSHALGTPIDFYSRGDLAVRNMTVIPTSPSDFPAVSIISKAVGNILNTAGLIGQGAPVGEALLHGLAHNGMNRPLQGLGNIALGYTSSRKGSKYFDNSNYIDYNAAEDWNWGATFARLIGSKPLNESIYMNEYFRDKGYQANMNDKLQQISSSIQLSQNAGETSGVDYDAWAARYEQIGGDPENFKAYWSRQITNSAEPELQKFKEEMEGDKPLGRLQGRMNAEYSQKPIWEY